MTLHRFKKIFNQVSNIGTANISIEERESIKLLNQLAFITALGGLLITLGNLFSFQSAVHAATTLSICVVYSIILILHQFGKIAWAKFHLCAIVPLWYSAAWLGMGGFFSQTMVPTATICIVYVYYENRKTLRNNLIIYNLILFLIPAIYNAYAPPLVAAVNIPLDELVVFLISLLWMTVVFKYYELQREKYIQKLLEHNEALKEKSEELERFSYIASHDLKSPLRTVVSFLGLIEKDISKKRYDHVAENLEFAKNGARQMNYLVSDILELSKVNNTGKQKNNWCDLNKILASVTTNIGEELRCRNAVIETNTLPQYFCNAVEFQLLFQNIIQNGVKYNEAATPEISIWSTQDEKNIYLHFKDNGIGIEKEYFPVIFQFFKRLHNSQEYNGTGLGLGLCKKIVQKYNGDIRVSSTPGEGSQFTIVLPTFQDSFCPKEKEGVLEMI